MSKTGRVLARAIAWGGLHSSRADNVLTPAEAAEGWRLLFDGVSWTF